MPQAVVAAVFKAAVGFAIASIGQSIMTSREEPGMPDTKQLGFQANARSTKVPLPLIYGTTRVGVNFWYMGTSGSDNKYLHLICAIGEGEIDSIDQVGGVDQIFLNNQIYTEYGSLVYYEFFNGSATQTVCSTLNSAISEWTDPLKHTAYLYLRLEYDRDVFQGVPNVTVTVNGLKCYDPTAETTAWTNNPALCVYDYLTRRSVRGGWGVDSSRINTASIESARSYCATNGWTCNLPIADKRAVADNMEMLLANFRGDLIYSGSQFTLKFRDLNEEAVVMTFDDEDGDIVDGSFGVSQPNVFSMPNAVKIIYLDEEGASDGSSTYKEKAFSLSNEATVTADGDYREQTYKCLGLSDLDKVQEMANYFYERGRANKMFSFTTGQDAMRLEPCDLIQLSHTVPGWSSKTGRVESVAIHSDLSVTVNCIEEFEDFYDSVFDPAAQTWYDTTLPNPLNEPYPVVNVSHSEEVYTVRGRSFTRWVIAFDLPDSSDDPFVEYADVELQIGSGDYKYMTKSESGYTVDPVEEGETYYVRMRTVNVFGVRQPLSNATIVSKTIVGKTSTPTNLSSMTAAANGDSVSIFADPTGDPDTEGYEVRLGDAWDGGIFISFNKNCSLRLNGVRPGTHTFWMSPKDNAGNYSATPVSATCKVFIPPGFTQLATYGSWSWDFSTGTFSNTEQDTYNTEDALKCSHTGDVLSGTWTSPTQDLNAVEDVRIWGDFRTAFESTDTTWDGVAPSGTTWNDLGASTKSWIEIFQPTEAGQIQGKLYFSTDNTNWSSVSFFEVICAEVTARYVYVEITLTDPTLDANLYLLELNMLAYEGPQ